MARSRLVWLAATTATMSTFQHHRPAASIVTAFPIITPVITTTMLVAVRHKTTTRTTLPLPMMVRVPNPLAVAVVASDHYYHHPGIVRCCLVGHFVKYRRFTTTTICQSSSSSSDGNQQPQEDDENGYNENKCIEARVRQWVDEIIIGLNLCPFAERSVRGMDPNSGESLMRITVVRGNSDTNILDQMKQELVHRTEHPGTTLVVCPECHPDDFLSYLDVVDLIETVLIRGEGYEGILQIAPFHPNFMFEGSQVDDDDNDSNVDDWTNKSPYPIFHILREDEVEAAADKLDGDAARVWKRNVLLLNEIYDQMGLSALERLYQGQLKQYPEERAQLKRLLRQFRIQITTTKTTTAQPPENKNHDDDKPETDPVD